MNTHKSWKSRENNFSTKFVLNLLLISAISFNFYCGLYSIIPAYAASTGEQISQSLYKASPELKIKPIFDINTPIHQGYLYSFQIQKADIEKEVNQLLAEKLKALGIAGENNYRAQILSIDSVEWMILNFDGTKISINKTFPNLIKNEGTSGNIDSSTLSYVFKTPTDPMDDSVVIAAATYTWSALDPNGAAIFNQPITNTAFGQYSFTVIDVEPPHNVKITPSSLSATCGNKISQFNDTIKGYGLTGKYQDNPEYIELTVIDDNPFGASPQSKLRHNLNNVDGFILIETYQEHYKAYDYNNPSKNIIDDPFELDSTIYEMLDSSKENGKFSYLKPVQISKIPGRQIQAFDISNKKTPDDNVGYIIKIPVAGLEEALELGEKDSSKAPVHFASMSAFQALDVNAQAEFKSRPEKALRITFAVCDSSGNWTLPDQSILNGSAVFNGLLKTVSALNPPTLGQLKYNTHKLYSNLYVFDDRRPNAAIIMTNTETNKTDIFTVPNSNLSTAPFSDNTPQWEFSCDANSPAMKSLPEIDRERFKNALTIGEDVRLLFKVIAYDNINQCAAGKNCDYYHGIATGYTMGNQNVKDSLRYVTWKINDPAAAEELLKEKQNDGQKIFVFPEYIFRKPDPGKNQSVEFEVCDTSPFYSPPSDINGRLSYSDENASKFNSRKIKLKFNIVPKTVSVTKMGGEEKTKSINAKENNK